MDIDIYIYRRYIYIYIYIYIKDHLETDKKKEVLREREIFWQRTLNSFQPYGLNKRTG